MSDKLSSPKRCIEWISDNLVIPAQPEFHCVEKFTEANPDIRFQYFNEEFKKELGGLTEKRIGCMVVRIGVVGIDRIGMKVNFSTMTPELGEGRILKMSQLYWMIEQQPNGEPPDCKNRRLVIDEARSNLYRIRNIRGTESAVQVYLIDRIDRGIHYKGWGLNAYDPNIQGEWNPGSRVIAKDEQDIWG